MQIIKPEYEINNDILFLLNSVSQSQGFLSASRISFQDFIEISALANIDAIHHSTRLEGNRLTHKQVTAIVADLRPILLLKKNKNPSYKEQKKIYEVDLLVCPKYDGGDIRVIAFIEDYKIQKFL